MNLYRVPKWRPDCRAVDHVVAWCRVQRRGGVPPPDKASSRPTKPNHNMDEAELRASVFFEGHTSNVAAEVRFDADQVKADLVDEALWRLRMNQSLPSDSGFRKLLMHVYGDGKSISSYRVGVPYPEGARLLGYDEARLVARAHKRVMTAIAEEIDANVAQKGELFGCGLGI